jgi:hypothetical protein
MGLRRRPIVAQHAAGEARSNKKQTLRKSEDTQPAQKEFA